MKRLLIIALVLFFVMYIIGLSVIDKPKAITHAIVVITFVTIATILIKKINSSPKQAPIKLNEFTTKYGFIFQVHSSQGFLIVGNPFRGILAVGGAGSGKTESIALPIIKQSMKKGYCGIVYDFKYPNLTNDFMKFRPLNPDLQACVINFNDVKNSHRVNPLDPVYIPNSSYAREYATSIIANLDKESIKRKDIWTRSAIDILTACIWYLKKHYPEYCTLPHAFRMILQDDEALMNVLDRDFEISDMVKSIINAIKREAGGQVAGQVGTLQSMIGQVNTPEIAYLLTGNDFTLDVNDPTDPKLLCIGTSPQLCNTHAPAISLIINVASKLMNAKDKQHSFILLDEFPTLYIPDIERLPATARENKVSTVLLCQDLSQIDDSYGQTKRDVIISNLGTQFYGRVSNQKTAEYISKLFGKDDVQMKSVSNSKSGLAKSSHTVSYSMQERANVKPQDVLKFNSGTFVGTTVDSPTPIFKEQFGMIERPNGNIVLDFGVKNVDLNENFKKIYLDIQKVFQGQESEKKGQNSQNNEDPYSKYL